MNVIVTSENLKYKNIISLLSLMQNCLENIYYFEDILKYLSIMNHNNPMKLVRILSQIIGFDYEIAVSKLQEVRNLPIPDNSPFNSLARLIHEQTEKEHKTNIWENSPFEELSSLQSNNVGVTGEQFINYLCQYNGIPASIDGTKTKGIGGGTGDGMILGKVVEIKTAHLGVSKSFQHELGEKPWIADYMIFADIAPQTIYLSIFPNFTEQQYKDCIKCAPYFQSRSICWRKKTGAFKFDTTIPINEFAANRINPNTLKITDDTSYQEIGQFISRIIV